MALMNYGILNSQICQYNSVISVCNESVLKVTSTKKYTFTVFWTKSITICNPQGNENRDTMTTQTKSFIVTNESLGKKIFEGFIMLDVKSWLCKPWFAVLPNLCDAVHMV